MQRGLWPGEKSRMSREAPVRFREGLGVQFPRATRLRLGTILVKTLDADDQVTEVIILFASGHRGRELAMEPHGAISSFTYDLSFSAIVGELLGQHVGFRQTVGVFEVLQAKLTAPPTP